MTDDSLSQRKAQLDKAEREHLEDVVEELRERVEDNVRYQLTQKGLDDEPEGPDTLDKDIEQLVEAIELEGVDGHMGRGVRAVRHRRRLHHRQSPRCAALYGGA